jgi:type I restriction enzyme S subunit
MFDGPFGSNLKSDDYVGSGVRVVRLENIAHLSFVEDKRTFISDEKFEALSRHSLQADDVLFSSFVAEQVRVCVLPALDSSAINKADCFCIRVDRQRCDPRFLAFRLACQSTFKHFEGQVHGATRPRINLRQLKAFEFDLPPLDWQIEIVRRVERAYSEIDRLTAEAAAARRLLDRLDQAVLAKAFRGELVPQDPADEPASVLLDRIRAERAAAPKVKRGRPKAVS